MVKLKAKQGQEQAAVPLLMVQQEVKGRRMLAEVQQGVKGRRMTLVVPYSKKLRSCVTKSRVLEAIARRTRRLSQKLTSVTCSQDSSVARSSTWKTRAERKWSKK